MDDERREQVARAVLDAARDENGRKRLKCAEAWGLAGRFDVEPIEIGRICEQHGIRITSCQLGLFK